MVTLALTESPQHSSHWKNCEISAHCLIHSSTDVEVRFCPLPTLVATAPFHQQLLPFCSSSTPREAAWLWWDNFRMFQSLNPMGTHTEGAGKCTSPFWQSNARHQLTPAQCLCSRHTHSHSPPILLPAKKICEVGSPDTGLHSSNKT